jgi:uncharacterized protein
MISRKSEWLEILRKDMEMITSKAALNHWPGSSPDDPPYFNYRLEHVIQVERDAVRLMETVGGDREIVIASVWIHDRFQPQYRDSDHPVQAEQWARNSLATLGFPTEKVEAVCYCVANHSSPPGAIPGTEEDARILWDADKLSKIGAVSVAALICGIPAFPDKVMGFCEIAQMGIDITKKFTSLPDDFYFDLSRRIATERLDTQKSYINGLAREVGLVE